VGVEVMKVKLVELIYVSLIHSKMLLGVEILGLEEGWVILRIVCETFCKRLIRVLGSAGNGAHTKNLIGIESN
jgi:hypothetical protein